MQKLDLSKIKIIKNPGNRKYAFSAWIVFKKPDYKRCHISYEKASLINILRSLYINKWRFMRRSYNYYISSKYQHEGYNHIKNSVISAVDMDKLYAKKVRY